MTQAQAIEGFLSQKSVALVGASRGGKKFGNVLLKELQSRGYDVTVVHPDANELDGVRCVPTLSALPNQVGAMVLVVKPERTAALVREAAQMGISQIWMQQGAASPEALQACVALGIQVVHGECLLMFLEPVNGIHAFHRWLWGFFGKLPRMDKL